MLIGSTSENTVWWGRITQRKWTRTIYVMFAIAIANFQEHIVNDISFIQSCKLAYVQIKNSKKLCIHDKVTCVHGLDHFYKTGIEGLMNKKHKPCFHVQFHLVFLCLHHLMYPKSDTHSWKTSLFLFLMLHFLVCCIQNHTNNLLNY